MIKLWMLLLSFNVGVETEDFIIKDEIVDKAEESIETDGYKLCQSNDKLILSKNDYELKTFDKDSEVKFITHNHKLVVTAMKNNQVTIYELNNLGQVLVEKTFLSEFTNIDLIAFKDSIYLVGGATCIKDDKIIIKDYHKLNNGIIIKLDSKYDIEYASTYGGIRNDEFIAVKSDNKVLYISGVKDSLSGGDFGNGGGIDKGYIFLKVDEGGNIIKTITFKEKIIDYYIFADSIYILTESNLYLVDEALNYQNSLSMSTPVLFNKFSNNNTLLVINPAGVKIYDLTSLKIIKEFTYDEITEVVASQGFLYLKTNDKIFRTKVYDLRSFNKNIVYRDGDIDSEVGCINNFFTEIPLTSKVISPAFDPMIRGKYKVEYIFDDLALAGDITVPDKVNITEGLVYPLGYRLEFTGVAYLNGVIVNNNHALMKTGKQELVLFDCNGESIKYNFTVSNEQITFTEDSTSNYEALIYPHDQFKITFKVSNINDVIVTGARINSIIYPVEVQDEMISVVLSEEMSGVYQYFVEEIYYQDHDLTFSKAINKEYSVKVLNPSVRISSNITNNNKQLLYNGNVEDIYQQTRGFKLYLRSNGEEEAFTYAIKDSDIVLRGLDPNKAYQAMLMLQYSLDDKHVEEIELIKVNVSGKSDVRIGNIDIIQAGESLEKFQVGFDLKNISEVYNLDKLVYVCEEEDFFSPLFSGLLIGIIISAIIIFIRLKKNKKPF